MMRKRRAGRPTPTRVMPGKITLRQAVESSKNTVAWSLFEELTPKVGISYLRNMNFSHLENQDEQMAASLGGFTRGVSALEMASGYAALENSGKYREPTLHRQDSRMRTAMTSMCRIRRRPLSTKKTRHG